MTEKSEWRFIVDYVKDSTTDFYNATCRSQLMALWTAYCIHHDLVVSSAVYEAIIGQLFFALSSEWLIHLCNGYRDRFEERIAQYL